MPEPPPDSSPDLSANPESDQATDAGDSQFTADGWETQAADATPEPEPPAIPGPGITESILWTLGTFAAHVLGAALVILTVVIISAAGADFGAIQDVLKFPTELVKDRPWILVGGEMLVFIVCAAGAMLVRYGRAAPQKLSLRPLPMEAAVLIVLMTVPLVMVGTELYRLLELIIPTIDFLGRPSTMSEVQVLAEKTSTPLLLLIIAVAPAVGEEIVFRGVIGRGLVARHGVLAGVAMTSILFAGVHLSPAHGLALLPFAVVIHVLYLATRSFWAPVLLHLANNACAVLALKLFNPPADAPIDGEGIPLPLFLLAAGFVVLITVRIWRKRVHFVLPDGTLWDPGYDTAESPPAHLQCRPL